MESKVHLQVQKHIVLHPGSLYLRIGRASDLNPITILHAIGRKRQKSTAQHRLDKLLPPICEEELKEFDEQRLQVINYLQTYVAKVENRGAKHLRVSTPAQQIATFNKRSKAEELPLDEAELESPHIKHERSLNIDVSQNNIFDKQILKLDHITASDYHIQFPCKRGELNLHAGLAGSMSALLADLEEIWLYALNVCMGIPTKLLPQYSVVLVVSDIYNRSHLREFVTLLLQRLRFRACFLLQDHVAATFGAGLGHACVVDIGDQKISISCVEDGVSQTDTRVRFPYGGADVTQVFYQILKRKCSFPYKECDISQNYSDAMLIMGLKEKFCHLNLEVCGAQEKSFVVKTAQKYWRYVAQFGDECLVAPFAFFHTQLLNITGRSKQALLQLPVSHQQDAEDCFDSEYIRETGRRNGRDQLLDGGTLPVTGETVEEELVVEEDANVKMTDREKELYSTNGQIITLDQAIVRCIERCANEELKRKMYSCVLLVGGSVKFDGFAQLLERSLKLQLAANRPANDQPPEVNVFIKEIDPIMIAWKGAAIMSCLESAPELWITAVEWQKYGLRALREKAIFLW